MIPLIMPFFKPDGTSSKTKSYSNRQHGIWEVLFMDEGHVENYRRMFYDAPKFLPSLCQLVQDIYSLSPNLLITYALCEVWVCCEQAVILHFTSKALRAIEHSLKEGVADFPAITYFIALRLVTSTIGSFFSWYSDRVIAKLRRRITSHFEMLLLRADFQHDLSQSGNPAEKLDISADGAWDAFTELRYFISFSMTVASQLVLILNLSRNGEGGILFALLCFLQPIVSTMVRQSPWDEVCIVVRKNEEQDRLETLSTLSKPQFRQDVISNNLQNFILDGYQATSEKLGDIPSDSHWGVFCRPKTPVLPMMLTLISDLPIVYCASIALLNPKKTSFASIAILQESASVLSSYCRAVLRSSQQFKVALKQIRDLYQATKDLDDGGRMSSKPSEQPTELVDAALREGEGMEFILENVSFSYPGSQVKGKSLTDINLTIKSGQFVVIVGANGGGKSTLLNLLLHLYKPPSESESEKATVEGKILIDSIPISSYSESSLRQSMAVLSQDNLLYPGFSLGENIGLGHAPLIDDENALKDAAIKAGAQPVLERMKDTMSTILDPPTIFYSYNVREQTKDHPLKKALENLQRPTKISGGEKQRVVAARTFMRLKSGKIRFLAVDEAGSALDSAAEELLLDNLLKEREGKTVVFVTHRFGKLTQKADLILCMSEGKIVESGTHRELMGIPNGEYKKLYDIQAQPFRDEAGGSPPSSIISV